MKSASYVVLFVFGSGILNVVVYPQWWHWTSLCSPSAQGTSSGLSLFSSATNVSSTQPSSNTSLSESPLAILLEILFSCFVQSCDPKCNCKTFLPHLLSLLNVQHAKHSLPCLLFSAVCKGTNKGCHGYTATNGLTVSSVMSCKCNWKTVDVLSAFNKEAYAQPLTSWPVGWTCERYLLALAITC